MQIPGKVTTGIRSREATTGVADLSDDFHLKNVLGVVFDAMLLQKPNVFHFKGMLSVVFALVGNVLLDHIRHRLAN